jgi:periplasmic divalent cation tolerance protein
MTDKLIVFVTCESREQAERLASTLVSEGLCACVNIVPAVRSCYVWEGKLTWSDELLLVIKTSRPRYDALEKRVRELHSYEVPEVVAVGIERGFEDYLRWLG